MGKAYEELDTLLGNLCAWLFYFTENRQPKTENPR